MQSPICRHGRGVIFSAPSHLPAALADSPGRHRRRGLLGRGSVKDDAAMSAPRRIHITNSTYSRNSFAPYSPFDGRAQFHMSGGGSHAS
jgi:hypothetical protein